MTIALKTASEIAAKAAELVGGEREAQHGNKVENFTKIATMWNAYLDIRPDFDAPLDATDVGHMMAAMKLARTQLGSLNIDDYVDGAGYFACAGEVAVATAPEVVFMKTNVVTKAEIDGVMGSLWWKNKADTKPTVPTPKFKVGDRVVYKKNTALGPQYGTYQGPGGVSVLSGRPFVSIQFDAGSQQGSGDYYPEDFDLAPFKVGDRVRYTRSQSHVITLESIDTKYGVATGPCSCGFGRAAASLSDLVPA